MGNNSGQEEYAHIDYEYEGGGIISYSNKDTKFLLQLHEPFCKLMDYLYLRDGISKGRLTINVEKRK